MNLPQFFCLVRVQLFQSPRERIARLGKVISSANDLLVWRQEISLTKKNVTYHQFVKYQLLIIPLTFVSDFDCAAFAVLSGLFCPTRASFRRRESRADED